MTLPAHEELMFEMAARKHLLPTLKAIADIRTMQQHFPELRDNSSILSSLLELSFDILEDYERLIATGISLGETTYLLVQQHNYKAYIALGKELEQQRKKGKSL